jgi:hypothetical protein
VWLGSTSRTEFDFAVENASQADGSVEIDLLGIRDNPQIGGFDALTESRKLFGLSGNLLITKRVYLETLGAKVVDSESRHFFNYPGKKGKADYSFADAVIDGGDIVNFVDSAIGDIFVLDILEYPMVQRHAVGGMTMNPVFKNLMAVMPTYTVIDSVESFGLDARRYHGTRGVVGEPEWASQQEKITNERGMSRELSVHHSLITDIISDTVEYVFFGQHRLNSLRLNLLRPWGRYQCRYVNREHAVNIGTDKLLKDITVDWYGRRLGRERSQFGSTMCIFVMDNFTSISTEWKVMTSVHPDVRVKYRSGMGWIRGHLGLADVSPWRSRITSGEAEIRKDGFNERSIVSDMRNGVGDSWQEAVRHIDGLMDGFGTKIDNSLKTVSATALKMIGTAVINDATVFYIAMLTPYYEILREEKPLTGERVQLTSYVEIISRPDFFSEMTFKKALAVPIFLGGPGDNKLSLTRSVIKRTFGEPPETVGYLAKGFEFEEKPEYGYLDARRRPADRVLRYNEMSEPLKRIVDSMVLQGIDPHSVGPMIQGRPSFAARVPKSELLKIRIDDQESTVEASVLVHGAIGRAGATREVPLIGSLDNHLASLIDFIVNGKLPIDLEPIEIKVTK